MLSDALFLANNLQIISLSLSIVEVVFSPSSLRELGRLVLSFTRFPEKLCLFAPYEMFQKAILRIHLVTGLECPFLATGTNDVFLQSQLASGTRYSVFNFACSPIIERKCA